MPKQTSLVSQYLENISRDALEKYQDIIKDYVSHQQGLYALYKGDKIYYVGLASNLRRRLRQHLNDRHGESWDRFSIYLTINSSHMKELETLLLRISLPKGNKVKGKFQKAESLRRRLDADIKEKQNRERGEIFGREEIQVKTPKRQIKKVRDVSDKSKRPLAGFLPHRIRIRAEYKGEIKRATLFKSGNIKFEEKSYSTPTAAAKAATKRKTISGWEFWQCKNEQGEWVRLSELRNHPVRKKIIRVRKKRMIKNLFFLDI